ncbi:MAG: DUF2784 family protein [Flavobacteriales bacterium]
MLPLLDVLFLIFHSSLILFNLLGWILRATRPWHLLMLILTVLSWTVMGYFYGWGYCICTDWHWQVLHEMGQHDLPWSYLSYLGQRFFGYALERSVSDTLAILGVLLPLGMNLFLRWREHRKAETKSF